MASYLMANNAVSTLAGAVTDVATTVNVAGGDGALFPNPTGGDFFAVTMFKLATGELEIVLCTARTGDALTVTRAQEGTTAIAFNSGDIIELRPTAGFFDSVAQIKAIQRGNYFYDATIGGPDTYQAAFTDANTAYVDGLIIWGKVGTTNTGVSTLGVDGLGPKSIKKHGGSDVTAGDLVAGRIYRFVYDGTNFQVDLPPITPEEFVGTAGTGAAYTISPNPAAVAYRNGMVYRIQMHAANTGDCTLNVSGLGAKSLYSKNLPLAAGRLSTSGVYEVVYIGSHFEVLFPDAPTLFPMSFDGHITPAKNLRANNASGFAATQVIVSADSVMLFDANGNARLEPSVSVTFDITKEWGVDASPANGRENGISEAVSTWYYLYAIGNNTGGTVSIIGSDHPPDEIASVALPAGYSYIGFVGAGYNQSNGDLAKMFQRGKEVSVEPISVLDDGASTTLSTIDVSVVVPEQAIACRGGTTLTNDVSAAAGSLLSGANNDIAGGDVRGSLDMSAPSGQGTFLFDLAMLNEQVLYYRNDVAASGVNHLAVSVNGYRW